MPRRERPLLAGNYQEKLGIHCRIQNRFCQHGWMINKLFTNNTCLVSRLNSIVFLSVRILLQPNQPMSSSTARSLADLDRVNTIQCTLNFNQYLTELSQRQQKVKTKWQSI